MGRARIDITGQRFGALVVKGYSHTSLNKAYWFCVCDCGNTIVCRGQNLKARLKTKRPQGCGCQMRKYPRMCRVDFSIYTHWLSEKKYKFGVDE